MLGTAPPTVDAVEALPFITRVVTESMRLFPPAWAIGRRAKEACEIGGYIVPTGSLVFMSQWTMHRDRSFYSAGAVRAGALDAGVQVVAPSRMRTFLSGGPRHCIGEPFAWMELVLVVATIVQRCTSNLHPGHPIVPQPLLTLRSKHGIRMIPRRARGVA